MERSIFNLDNQQEDLNAKIVIGLERIAEVYRTMLWDLTKKSGLSPIQIQILIFIAYHKDELCNVSHLAQEFNLTKATISDAVRALHKKELIEKHYSLQDKRAYTISLSKTGEKDLKTIETYPENFIKILDDLPFGEKESFFRTLSKIIFLLNKSGLIQIQRTCFNCRFYLKAQETAYCKLLQKPLATKDLRLDCPEFESKN